VLPPHELQREEKRKKGDELSYYFSMKKRVDLSHVKKKCLFFNPDTGTCKNASPLRTKKKKEGAELPPLIHGTLRKELTLCVYSGEEGGAFTFRPRRGCNGNNFPAIKKKKKRGDSPSEGERTKEGPLGKRVGGQGTWISFSVTGGHALFLS